MLWVRGYLTIYAKYSGDISYSILSIKNAPLILDLLSKSWVYFLLLSFIFVKFYLIHGLIRVFYTQKMFKPFNYHLFG